ncbi:MAG: hypothetical protein COZ91_01345 [Candidatus Nealsonbacteria bacterium CG_4_8_14_3_um_filter_39_7]|uniref:DUF4258 domain-containing protein n=1 Tax=Candidatus Nealsonbacteria bacterium CG23_combo_of_CG06-09_8_20_14_all_39_17 TaxID=1974722 RepID=A0A2G9YU83_9BACT|nr:MAG: hypothetical protein COX37_02240 [Candidatus Nealsonbacteria bacterium CG23_combo_of_CG06-09_8_20_14_all_39_17]PIW91320.1 MAG: hypothetical protein COZ91_01345 [Candidatus Nealsonbacteria bacterium CG_4_8_14_3_um_filter_39_7]
MIIVERKPEKILWTEHSKRKMRYYRLSEGKVLRVLRRPDRKEEGIAPKTIAVMQKSGTKKRPTEIWMMYQIKNEKLRKVIIISAWRYPGISPIGEKLPIPIDILEELSDLIN